MPPAPMHPAVPIAVPRCPWQVSHSFASSRSPPLLQSEVTFRKPVLPEDPPRQRRLEPCSFAPSTKGGSQPTDKHFAGGGVELGSGSGQIPSSRSPPQGGQVGV